MTDKEILLQHGNFSKNQIHYLHRTLPGLPCIPHIFACRVSFVIYFQSMPNSRKDVSSPKSFSPDFYPPTKRVGRKCGNINAQISFLSVVTQVQVPEECCNKQTGYLCRTKYWTRRKVNVSISIWKYGILVSATSLVDVFIFSLSYWLA